MRRLAPLLLVAAGCGTDPCGGYAGTCVGLIVEGNVKVDGLVVTVLTASGTAFLDHKRTPPTPGGPIHDLPVKSAVGLGQSEGRFTITVDAVLGQLDVGTATADVLMARGEHRTVTVTVGPRTSDGGTDLASGARDGAVVDATTGDGALPDSALPPDLADPCAADCRSKGLGDYCSGGKCACTMHTACTRVASRCVNLGAGYPVCVCGSSSSACATGQVCDTASETCK